MKKTLLTITLISMSFIVKSQTTKERDAMISTYNREELNTLFERLNNSEKGKQSRIDNYLKSHTNINFKTNKEGQTYIIFDIIDGKPVYQGIDNRSSAIATRASELLPGGSSGLNLEGEDMVFGVWEINYPLLNHQEFILNDGTSKITTPDTTNPTPEPGPHATHVNGTIAARGINQSAKGMAPKASLLAYNNINDETETATAHLNTGMLLSNHSYGVYIFTNGEQTAPTWLMGCYSSDASNWDAISYANPYYLMVTSAGNSGTVNYSGGFFPTLDKLTMSANSKNNLVVANANIAVNILTRNITQINIAPSSSQGPTDDGRIKPDITGRGTGVFSAIDDSTTSYDNMTGTSMSSPNVAGSLLLVQEHYNNINGEFMTAATLKGLACHTATDDANITGPDPYFGYGVLNALEAAETITAANNGDAILNLNNLAEGQVDTYEVTIAPGEALKATISWTDPSGIPQDQQLNSTTPALVNDLDIRITDESGNTYYPWKLDMSSLPNPIKGDNIVDNLEKIEIDTPAAGTYTITVSHKGSLTSGAQDYALIVTGANLTMANENNFAMNDIKVWPNPATDILNIQLEESSSNVSFEIYDIYGKRVFSQKANDYQTNYTIPLQQLTQGIYLLNINNGEVSQTQKIIKK